MSVTLHSIPIDIEDEKAELPGTTFKVSNTGLITGSATFQIDTESLPQALEKLGRFRHPRYPYMVQEGEAIVVQGEGGLTTIAVDFAGTLKETTYSASEDNPEIETPPTFTSGRATSQEPLATNPYYDELSSDDKLEVVKAWEASDGTAKPAAYNGWADRKKELYDNLASGVHTWRSPGLTWQVSYASTKPLPDVTYAFHGMICKPWGPAPKLGEDRDWILDDIQETQVGEAYQFVLTWIASGPGGWTKEHYSRSRYSKT